ncbi:MAG: response regulator transcription factor [Candidatus Aenigmatarchaeota archaeon]
MKLLLVDDHHYILDGLRPNLERTSFTIIEARDGQTAWRLMVEHVPRAAIIDIAILPYPGAKYRSNNDHGIELARRIKEAFPSTGVVLFSNYEDRLHAVSALLERCMCGLAYKLKSCTLEELISAVHAACDGRVVVDPDVVTSASAIAERILRQLSSEERPLIEAALQAFESLSAREVEAAYLLAAANKTHRIAHLLGVKSKSAENYLNHIYDKLGLGQIAPHLRKDILLAKTCMIRDLQLMQGG